MNLNNNKLTESLAVFVSEFDCDNISESMMNQVKSILMDFFSVTIAGSQTDISQIVYKYLLDSEGSGNSNVIGHEHSLSKSAAAFINGTSAHTLDFDDGYSKGSMHPAAVVIPAVLAVSEREKSSPSKIAGAIIIGYEVSLRIAASMHPVTRERGFHNTPLAGVFGAAAAVSYLYGFKKEEVQSALGNAASFSGGLFAFLGTGSEIKRVHPGQAARDGMIAAELAKNGVIGPANVLEGKNGFFQSYTDNKHDVDVILENLGKEYELFNIYFKPYPFCRHLHVIIDVIFKIKNEYKINVREIQQINLGVNRIASLHNHVKCNTLLDAQMSLPYATAATLLYDILSIDVIDPKQVSEELWDLSEKVHIYIDDYAEKEYPRKRAGKVEIILENGEKLTGSSDNPLGEPSKPLSYERLKKKFLDNCSPIIGKDKATEFLRELNNFHNDPSFLYRL